MEAPLVNVLINEAAHLIDEAVDVLVLAAELHGLGAAGLALHRGRRRVRRLGRLGRQHIRST